MRKSIMMTTNIKDVVNCCCFEEQRSDILMNKPRINHKMINVQQIYWWCWGVVYLKDDTSPSKSLRPTPSSFSPLNRTYFNTWAIKPCIVSLDNLVLCINITSKVPLPNYFRKWAFFLFIFLCGWPNWRLLRNAAQTMFGLRKLSGKVVNLRCGICFILINQKELIP